jgi:uncharacterized protein YjbJ (UPF0337 family)
MNRNRIEGSWMQLKGKVRQQWGHWIDDDYQVLIGHRAELAGKMRQRHGLAEDEAERQAKDLDGRMRDPWSAH